MIPQKIHPSQDHPIARTTTSFQEKSGLSPSTRIRKMLAILLTGVLAVFGVSALGVTSASAQQGNGSNIVALDVNIPAGTVNPQLTIESKGLDFAANMEPWMFEILIRQKFLSGSNVGWFSNATVARIDAKTVTISLPGTVVYPGAPSSAGVGHLSIRAKSVAFDNGRSNGVASNAVQFFVQRSTPAPTPSDPAVTDPTPTPSDPAVTDPTPTPSIPVVTVPEPIVPPVVVPKPIVPPVVVPEPIVPVVPQSWMATWTGTWSSTWVSKCFGELPGTWSGSWTGEVPSDLSGAWPLGVGGTWSGQWVDPMPIANVLAGSGEWHGEITAMWIKDAGTPAITLTPSVPEANWFYGKSRTGKPQGSSAGCRVQAKTLTAKQIRAISPAALRATTSRVLNSLSDAQFPSLTPQQTAKLRAKQVSRLTATKAAIVRSNMR